jgi:hypothetical protein
VLESAPISDSSIAKPEALHVATTVSAEAAAAVTAAALLLELLIAIQLDVHKSQEVCYGKRSQY